MPCKPNSPLLLQRFLPYRLTTLSNKISQALAAQYSQRFDLSIPEWRILAVLGEGTALSAAEIVQRTAMDKVAVSRAVKKLLEKQRLEKNQDSNDNRRFSLSLSESGQALYEEVVPIALEYERRLIAELSHDEIENMDKLFNHLDNVILK
ncbi:MarR family winged helix-turn-helix transcriptional regulator [Bowmanella yangjiangensis]|uniref:MarR family transcriptional regulator n=1 Tax=Bowmanella yangjiangensis TaxID=2811230 RepID=A0ABS3CYU2_9ALTE|nr:MarR family transcriptional regulator [Bowmanella yangjiangensis]MBN7821745.1 MarR family transcriptional regulator [Bowmanella yangjiangensis]